MILTKLNNEYHLRIIFIPSPPIQSNDSDIIPTENITLVPGGVDVHTDRTSDNLIRYMKKCVDGTAPLLDVHAVLFNLVMSSHTKRHKNILRISSNET